MAVPTTDTKLVPYSTNVDTRLTASPATYGVLPADATAYHAVHAPYITAYNNVVAAREAGTRSRSLSDIKNAAKEALLDYARLIYARIQINPAVTDAAKIELGVVVKDNEPTPVPLPSTAPTLKVDKVYGHEIKLEILNGTKRSRPKGCIGAQVYSFVGAEAPADTQVWKNEGLITRSPIIVVFPESVPPGAKVWLTASWLNTRGLTGPGATPIMTGIGYEGSMPLAA